jgi:predicted nucleic acid-binding protein
MNEQAFRIYLDSNVFISFFNEEIGRHLRPLFVEAEEFFKKAKDKNQVIVLSELFFEEVEKLCFLDKNGVLEFLSKTGVKIELAQASGNISFSEFRNKLHYSDALHAAIAVKSKCDCIVTFNAKDFEGVKSIIAVFEPSEIT